MDIPLVRILLKQLCTRPAGDDEEFSSKAVFDWEAAPGYEDQRESVRTHYELQISKGIAEVGRIHMKHHPDFAVVELTERGRTWCRYAHDDEQWEQHTEELRSLLSS